MEGKAIVDAHQLIDQFMNTLIAKNPGETEFHQAVREVSETIIPFINANPRYQKKALLERLTEPDRLISFRVSWIDDAGDIQVNKGESGTKVVFVKHNFKEDEETGESVWRGMSYKVWTVFNRE